MQKENFAWARHSKSLSAGPCEVTCMDLAIDLIYEMIIYGRSLSAGPLRLRIRIWPLTRGFGSTTSTLRPVGKVISLCWTL